MEEKRINTIVTEESIVESLHKQLDNNEFSMLEKALKAFGQSKSDVSDIDILIDCTSEELQSVNYCELTEKFSKLTKIGVLNRTPLNLKSPMNSGHFYPLNKIYKQDI